MDRPAPQPPARTVELYRWLLARHIGPHLGRVALGKITPEMIREWRATLLGSGVSVSAAAKACRLLRAVLMTAAIAPALSAQIEASGKDGEDRPDDDDGLGGVLVPAR